MSQSLTLSAKGLNLCLKLLLERLLRLSGRHTTLGQNKEKFFCHIIWLLFSYCLQIQNHVFIHIQSCFKYFSRNPGDNAYNKELHIAFTSNSAQN